MAPRTRKPPPDHAILELDRFLPYRLSVLSNRISQDIAAVYGEKFGLTVTEWRILAVLGRYPDLSATEVAERTAMDKVAVSRAVTSLLTTAPDVVQTTLNETEPGRGGGPPPRTAFSNVV